MITIAPSLLSADFGKLSEELAEVAGQRGFAGSEEADEEDVVAAIMDDDVVPQVIHARISSKFDASILSSCAADVSGWDDGPYSPSYVLPRRSRASNARKM